MKPRRQSITRFAVCSAVVLLGSTVLAQSTKLQPWLWTLDERLADRFDPAKIRERDEAYVVEHPQIRTMPPLPAPGPNEIRYRIEGKRNPELFLSHELFVFLLRSGFNPVESRRTRGRALLAAGLKKEGFDPDTFWRALESVSASYLAMPENSSGRDAVNKQCRARYDALNDARRLFGADRFDRFLYTAVAPAQHFSAGTSMPYAVKRLREEAEGCVQR